MTSATAVDVVPAPPLAPGSYVLRGYRVVAHLRRGDRLDAYDVWSEKRECRCVVKSLRPDRMCSEAAREAILREGRLLRRLSHPHVVRLYELVQRPPALILEALPGVTLSHLLAEHADGLPLPDLGQLASHLCSALSYLHRQGWLHLDLKPSNIVCDRGFAKVLDLSIAQPVGSRAQGAGTTGYMAPEQHDETSILGPATDVWGLGAVLVEAATGRAAIERAHAGRARLDRRVPNVCQLPPSIASVLVACLDPDPLRRPHLAELTQVLLAHSPRAA